MLLFLLAGAGSGGGGGGGTPLPVSTGLAFTSADMDDMLADFGSKAAIITRPTNGATVSVRVFFRAKPTTELAANGAIFQQAIGIIMSATEILNAAADSPSTWPGTTPTGFPGDPRIPAVGDSISIEGRDRSILSAYPIYVNDVLIRVNLDVKG